jgi:hypothetical protein
MLHSFVAQFQSLKTKTPAICWGWYVVVNDLLRSHQLRPYPPQAQGLVLAEGDLLKVRNGSTWN